MNVSSEGIFETAIDLNQVVCRPIEKVQSGFAEEPDVGSKAVFESTAKMAKHPIRSKVVTGDIYSGESGYKGYKTCFEETTGSPAKMDAVCDASASTAKAITFFIKLIFSVVLA